MKSQTIQNRVGIAILAIGMAIYVPAAQAGRTCKDSAGNTPDCVGTNTPCVCVEKPGAAPSELFDFTFDFADPANPNVTLLKGSQDWNVWSQVDLNNTTPANLGAVTLKPSVDTDNFGVAIENPDIGGPGAANVGSMVLKDTDPAATWIGNSGISAGTISGNLAGDLEVVQDAAGGGGSVKLTVLGNTTGTIDIARIAPGDQLQIDGTASGDITITGDIENNGLAKGTVDIGTFTGESKVLGDVNGDFTIDTLRNGDMDPLWDVGFSGDVGANAVITIGAFQDDPWLQFWNNGGLFAGKLCLPTGIPDAGVNPLGTIVQFYSRMNGEVDLNGADVDALLNLDSGGSGNVLNGGDIGDMGVVVLAGSSVSVAFTGTATFGDVRGIIEAFGNDHDGTLTVDSIATTGKVWIGTAAGAAHDLGGTIHVTNAWLATGAVAAGGEIVVYGNLESAGKIEVDGPMKGSVTVKGLASGSVLIDDKLEGGTLTFEGNATSTASVRVNNMTSVGATHSLVDMQGIFDADMLLDSGIPANQTVQIVGALDLHGEIDLSAGAVAGSLSFDGGSGNVIDGGAVTGSVSLGDGDAYLGTATFTSVSAAGTISTERGAALAGTLAIADNMAGSIGIGGVGASPSQADLMSGGKIWIRQDLLGTVLVGGSLSGDIDVDNDLTSTGTVIVKHLLNATGRVLIDADCDGAISVGEQTAANSLISMRNFAGTITINSSEGAFGAKGDISIGAAGLPLPSVAFDGSILVMDDAAGGSGHLWGDIDITGCHPANHGFLDICIEGNELGSVNIVQGTCSDPVCGYQCGGGACP